MYSIITTPKNYINVTQTAVILR